MKNQNQTEQRNAQHTPGPWRVMADPVHKGEHPFHDSRWIATADALVEFSPYVSSDWGLECGTLICQMRDGPTANAHLLAAAPDLLAACRMMLANAEEANATTDQDGNEFPDYAAARNAIARATGQTS